MFNFVKVQGRRKFKPEEYMEYFEDWNLSLTPKFDKRGHFANAFFGR